MLVQSSQPNMHPVLVPKAVCYVSGPEPNTENLENPANDTGQIQRDTNGNIRVRSPRAENLGFFSIGEAISRSSVEKTNTRSFFKF